MKHKEKREREVSPERKGCDNVFTKRGKREEKKEGKPRVMTKGSSALLKLSPTLEVVLGLAYWGEIGRAHV